MKEKKLSLKEFIELFNEDESNELWSNFFIDKDYNIDEESGEIISERYVLKSRNRYSIK